MSCGCNRASVQAVRPHLRNRLVVLASVHAQPCRWKRAGFHFGTLGLQDHLPEDAT